MQWALLLFAAVAGLLNTLQSGANATLNKRLEHPLASATVVYLAGLTLIALGWIGAQLLGRGGGLPAHDRVLQVPWWGWMGGTLGLVFVFGTLIVAPKLGAAVYTSISVSVAVITSIVLDHFGWMGFEQHAAGWGRILGAVLIVAGLVLIGKF